MIEGAAPGDRPSNPARPRVYLHTFGCRANQADTAQLEAALVGAGATIAARVEDADVAVFNSCAVTADAVADLRQQVRRAATRNPSLDTVVTGCAATLDDGAIRALPTVRDVVPGFDLAAIATVTGLRVDAPVVIQRQGGVRANLRIQDGCDEHCTFCATTLARGGHRSVPADVVVERARALAEHHAEVVLTGVHIGHWGREWGHALGHLVQRLVREVPAVRFRLSSVEATEVDGALVECFAHPMHLAPHLHAPLQSASDRVLRRMGRHWYVAADYARAIERLAARVPLLGLGADIIAGFPGEDVSDHEATLALVSSLPFTYLHVFPYSPRPGTAAPRLGGDVPPVVARARAADLRALGEERSRAAAVSRLGKALDLVMISGSRREGLTGDYLAVRVDGPPRGRGERFSAWGSRLEERTLVVTPIVAE